MTSQARNERQVYELFIRATRERLWQALTEGEVTAKYFFGTRVSSSWKVGAPLSYQSAVGATLVSGEVLTHDPGKELAHTWKVHYDPALVDEVSTIRWHIEERGLSCKLTVVHELAGAPKTASNVAKDGWSVVLSGLKTLLETGSPLEILPSA